MLALSCPDAIRDILSNLASDIVHYKPETPGDFFRLACKERNSLHYGIEMEFAKCTGLQGEVRTREEWEEVFADNFQEWLLDAIPGMSAQTAKFFANNLYGDVETFVDKFTPWQYTNVLDEFIEQNRSDEEDFADVSGWEHSEDATEGIVREYRTEEPNKFYDTLDYVSHLLDQAGEWEIPHNGSCHVHISVPGMRHSLTEASALHCCILWELSQLRSLFPSCLEERFRENERYFKFDASPGTKFSCVHSHPQGSIEFRLWGAAKSVHDVEWFLKISAAAFLLGYLRFAQRRYNDELGHDMRAIKLFRSQFRSAILEENPLEESEIFKTPEACEREIWETIAGGICYGGEFPPVVDSAALTCARISRCFGEFPPFCLNRSIPDGSAGRHILAE
jgi:hypothetical protein